MYSLVQTSYLQIHIIHTIYCQHWHTHECTHINVNDKFSHGMADPLIISPCVVTDDSAPPSPPGRPQAPVAGYAVPGLCSEACVDTQKTEKKKEQRGGEERKEIIELGLEMNRVYHSIIILSSTCTFSLNYNTSSSSASYWSRATVLGPFFLFLAITASMQATPSGSPPYYSY